MMQHALFDAPAPPDAGNTYLGAYTLTNPWAVYLIGRAPELVALTPSRTSQAEQPPLCPMQPAPWMRCGEPMLLRVGYWACYRHGDEVVRVPVSVVYERAPEGDVLSLAGA